jgi:hypothetical protein
LKRPYLRTLVTLGLFFTLPVRTVAGDDSSSGVNQPAEYSVSAFGYWVEGEDFFVLPIVTADFGTLNLEGRYNYEDLRTGSLFAGYNFRFGSEIEVLLTPMAGVAFGRTNGLIPALEAEISYDIFGFSLEGEYVFDLEDSEANFAYFWSELYVSPTEWLYAGLAGQRMRVVGTDVEVSRGVLVGGSLENFSATLYLFDFTEPESFVVLGIEWIP